MLGQFAVLGGFVSLEDGTAGRGERKIAAAAVGSSFGPAQILPPHQAVHGFAGGGVAHAEKSGNVADVVRFGEIEQLQHLQLRKSQLLPGDFREQLLLHHAADRGHEQVCASE